MTGIFGPIQRVLLRGRIVELEDAIPAIEALLTDEDGVEADLTSIEQRLNGKQKELARLRVLLA